MPTADLLSATTTGRRYGALAVLAAVVVAATGVGLALEQRWRPEQPAPVPVAPVAGHDDSGRPRADSGRAGDSPAIDVALAGRSLTACLADVAGEAALGLVVAPAVTGEVTAMFPAGVGWRERLEALARVHAFEYRIGDTLIEVSAATRSARRFAGDVGDADAWPRPAPSRAAVPDTTPAPVPPPATVPPPVHVLRVVRLTNARAPELAEVLDRALRHSEVALAADASSNALVVSGPGPAVAELARLAGELDVPKRSFLLEARIIEVKRSARNERGIRWLLESGDFTGFVDFPAADGGGEQAGIIVATTGQTSLRAHISALEADGKIRVVSRPRVIVLEGKPALIESVRILRVRLPDRGSVLADADEISVTGTEQAVEEIPVGVSLWVEPAMQAQGKIALRIRAKSSNLGPPLPPDDIPEELSRVVETDVIVGDGQTAVLGGLRRDAHSRSGSGVPVLRSIPVVGALFGKRKDEREGEELIVLITPRLLGTGAGTATGKTHSR